MPAMVVTVPDVPIICTCPSVRCTLMLCRRSNEPSRSRTVMTEQIPDEDKIVFAKRRTALGRYAEPEEVAHGTFNFCLPASQYMTGAVLPVDGGLLIKNA